MRSVRNCSVCVVGGAGFLGSHLINHLVENRHCKVLVIDNLCAGRREFVHKDAEFLHHDITLSESFLTKAFKERGVKFVMNFAAWPYVPDSFSRPSRVCEVNFNGAINVINASQEAGCEGVLQVSSAEIYGDAAKIINGDTVYNTDHLRCREQDYRIKEDGPASPHSSYGASKLAVDAYCQVAWRERQAPVIALRQFNACGERETHPYVIPEIISQLDKFRYESIHGDASKATVYLGNNSFRDFIYAGDAVRIAVELLERGQFGEVYNLGSEKGIKIYDLAKLIGKLMGFANVQVVQDKARVRPWEIWHLCADVSKLRGILCVDSKYPYGSAHPSTSQLDCLTPFDEALRRTIKWFEDNGRRWPWQN